MKIFLKSERFEFWFLLIAHAILLVIANLSYGYNNSTVKEWHFNLELAHSTKILLSYYFFVTISKIARK